MHGLRFLLFNFAARFNMNKAALLFFLLLSVRFPAGAQTPFSGDPDQSLFLTTDIDHFWTAYDLFVKDTSVNPFGPHYLEVGSKGVKGFTPFRIRSADYLYNTVKRHRADYDSIRQNTLRIHETEKQCRSAFYALKYWYPEAVYPPVYFVIGTFNSGGTFNKNGLFIGAEMQKEIGNIPHIVAHELIHFQQKNWVNQPNLLRQSLVEGSADFIGELISGKHINPAAHAYGDRHLENLCREFVARMDSTDYQDWLYGVSGKDDRPNDLGYWMGYKITQQYFNKSADKPQAIRDILDIKDPLKFLRASGFLDPYLE